MEKDRAKARAITAILAGLMVVCLSGTVQAHKPLLSVQDNSDGSVTIEAGFSDGSSAAGHKIILKNEKTGEVISEHRVGEDGTLQLKIPSVPYTVTLDAGEGHVVTQRGPAGSQTESASAPMKNEAPNAEPAPPVASSAQPQSQTKADSPPPSSRAQTAPDVRMSPEMSPGAVMAFKMMITVQIVTAAVLVTLLALIAYFIGYDMGKRAGTADLQRR